MQTALCFLRVDVQKRRKAKMMGMFKIEFGRHSPISCQISDLVAPDYFVYSPGVRQGQVRTVHRLEGYSRNKAETVFHVGKINSSNLSYVRDDLVYPVNVRFQDGTAIIEYRFEEDSMD